MYCNYLNKDCLAFLFPHQTPPTEYHICMLTYTRWQRDIKASVRLGGRTSWTSWLHPSHPSHHVSAQTAAGTAGTTLRAGPTGWWDCNHVSAPAHCCLQRNVWPWAWKMLSAACLALGKTVILEWIFWVFLKCTWWSLTKYPALTAQHKVAGPCHCPTPAGAGALCLTSTPASMGQGPSLPPTAPSPAPSCTTMDFTRWSVTRANRHFHTLHLPLKAHRLQVRTFQLHQMPCGATSTSTTEGCAPKLRSQCHLSVASYRKYFPHMKGLYFCLSCSEIHRPVNKFQETIKSEKAVSN